MTPHWFWVAGHAIPGIGDTGSGTVLGVGNIVSSVGDLCCLWCLCDIYKAGEWIDLSTGEMSEWSQRTSSSGVGRLPSVGLPSKGSEFKSGFWLMKSYFTINLAGMLLLHAQPLEFLSVYILKSLNKNQHSSLLWKIHLFFFLAGLLHSHCVSLRQEEAVQLIIWHCSFSQICDAKGNLWPQLWLSVLGRRQLHVWVYEQEFAMESLGLQTVTLSDGTTAYVQQAIKGISGDLRVPPCPRPRVSRPPCLPACLPQPALHENLSRWLMERELVKMKCHAGRLENQTSLAIGAKTSERQVSWHVVSGS